MRSQSQKHTSSASKTNAVLNTATASSKQRIHSSMRSMIDGRPPQVPHHRFFHVLCFSVRGQHPFFTQWGQASPLILEPA